MIVKFEVKYDGNIHGKDTTGYKGHKVQIQVLQGRRFETHNLPS